MLTPDIKILLQNFLTLLLVAITVNGTPQFYRAEDGKEYFIETELKYNWQQASNECARRNSQLVVIDSADKNNAIIKLLKNVLGKSHNLWLGGNDEFNTSRDYNRPFFWSPTGKRFTFTYWSKDNPDNFRKREHCVHIWDAKSLYEWNDIECTRNMGFICEVNNSRETSSSQIKDKCQKVKEFSSSILADFNHSQKQQQSIIYTKTLNVNRMAANWKTELLGLQNTTLLAIHDILVKEQTQLKHMSEKMLKQLGDLNWQLKRSAQNVNTQFGRKLSAKRDEIEINC